PPTARVRSADPTGCARTNRSGHPRGLHVRRSSGRADHDLVDPGSTADADRARAADPAHPSGHAAQPRAHAGPADRACGEATARRLAVVTAPAYGADGDRP